MRILISIAFTLVFVSFLGCSSTGENVKAPISEVTASESAEVASTSEGTGRLDRESSSRTALSNNLKETKAEPGDDDWKGGVNQGNSESAYLGLDRPKQVPLSHYTREIHETKSIDPTVDRLFQNPPSERRRKKFEEKQRLKAEAKQNIPAAAVGGGLDPVADARFDTLEIKTR